MARPKEKTSFRPGTSQALGMSQAFENKSHQEHEKLLVKVAAGLNGDLVSLFEQELHADLIVTNGNCDVRAHHCILQARAKHLWQERFLFPITQSDSVNVQGLRVNAMSERQIRDFLRQLYCVTESELLFEEFLPNIQLSSTLEQTAKVFSSDTSTSTPNQTVAVIIENTDFQENCSLLCDAKTKRSSGNEVKDDCQNNCSLYFDDQNKHVRELECDIGTEVKNKRNEETHFENMPEDVINTTNGEFSSDNCVKNVLSLHEKKDETYSEDNIANFISEVKDEIQGDLVAHDSNESTYHTQSHNVNGFIIHETPGESVSMMGGLIETNHIIDSACTLNIPSEVNDENSISDHKSHVTSVKNENLNDNNNEEGASTLESVSIKASERLLERREDRESFTSLNEDEKSISRQTYPSLSETKESACCISSDNIQIVSVDNKNDIEGKSNFMLTTAASGEVSKNESDETQKTSDMKADECGSSDSYKDKNVVDSYRTCNPLGRDLLPLYLRKLHCDCCLSVEGVQFLAHKCILSARSPYFSAMFGGQWSESNLEVVSLEGVSASAMEKVLLFFYGGVIDTISSTDLFDLFVIADMYGVETMKLVLQFFLKRDMCHFFHKPCSTCITRAPEALSLCHSFFLEELQDRVLKWISKYFMKIWCTKAFAAHSEALHQLCLEAMVKQMTELNVLDIIMDCDKLTTSLPRIKWTESILCLTTQLMDLAIEYTSSNFVKVIHAPEFLTWAKVACWKASALEEIFNSVIDSLPVDTGISVYQTMLDLKSFESMSESPEQNLLDLLDTMIKRCEKFLRTHIHLVTRSKQWSSINKSFQSQILENSSYYHLDHFPDPKPRPKKPVMFSSLIKSKQKSASPSSTSSSSSQAQGPKRTSTSNAARNMPPSSREKPPRNTSKDNATPEKTTPQSGAGNSIKLTSKQTKSLRISSRPPSKGAAKSSTAEPSQNLKLKDKGTISNDLLQKDTSNSSQAQGSSSSSSSPKSISIKNPTTASLRPSTSLPSGRKSPGLGKSPPSRIPQKTTRGKSQEELVKHQGKKSSFSSDVTDGTVGTCDNFEEVPSSRSVSGEIHEEGVREANVVFMTEKNADVFHATKFESLQAEGGNLPECFEGHIHTGSNEATVDPTLDLNGLGSEIMGDISLLCTSSPNDFDGHKNQVSNGTEASYAHSEAVERDVREEENVDSMILQQEITFVNTTKPVKLSFVVPSNIEEEEQPP